MLNDQYRQLLDVPKDQAENTELTQGSLTENNSSQEYLETMMHTL